MLFMSFIAKLEIKQTIEVLHATQRLSASDQASVFCWTSSGLSLLLSGIVSMMTLCALAYERYIRVVHAKVIDFPWAWRAITHIWLYSLAWTGAPLLGWNRYTLEIHQLGCSLDWASKDPNDASFIIFFLLACFFVPVGVMAYCYGNILFTVHKVRKKLQWSEIISFSLIYIMNGILFNLFNWSYVSS